MNFTEDELIQFETEYNEYLDTQSRQAYWYEELERLAQENQGHASINEEKEPK